MSEELEALVKRSRANLKKIAASSGAHRGFFLFAKLGDAWHLNVTLQRQDPRGKKACQQLEALLDGFKKGKKTAYVQGEVYCTDQDKRLVFHVSDILSFKGVMPDPKLRPGLRQKYPKAHSGLGFLKQALIKRGDGPVEEADLSETEKALLDAEMEEDLVLTDEDREILADEEALCAATVKLGRKLGQRDKNQQAERILRQILELARGSDTEALKAKRVELARVLNSGKDLLKAGKSEIDDPELQLFLAATDSILVALFAVLQAAHDDILEIEAHAGSLKEDPVALGAYAPQAYARLLVARAKIDNVTAQVAELPLPAEGRT